MRVAILNAGADDLIPLPEDICEVVARLRCILRRRYNQPSTLLKHNGITLDTSTREVKKNGQIVKLTAREIIILELLLLHHPRLLSRAYLEAHLSTWTREISSNLAEVYISHLRSKLGKFSIETVHGQGYRLK